MIDYCFNSFTAAYTLPEVAEMDRSLDDDYKLMTVLLLVIRNNTMGSMGVSVTI
jgi:hypothetical protein